MLLLLVACKVIDARPFQGLGKRCDKGTPGGVLDKRHVVAGCLLQDTHVQLRLLRLGSSVACMPLCFCAACPPQPNSAAGSNPTAVPHQQPKSDSIQQG
jgi:hypothetical protein